MDESGSVSMSPCDWANSGSADDFLGVVNMVLVPRELVLFYRMGVEFKGEILSNYSSEVK